MAKNIKYSPNSGIRTYRGDGTEMLQCVLLADEAPASLEISGADVEGLNDNTVIAAGSVLITPGANYIAFTDGVFTKKE